MIKKEDIFDATDGGKAVITHYYPQSSACFRGSGSKNFRIREDDKNPSATVFCKDGIWFVQDKGGSDNKARTAIQIVQEAEGLGFPQAIEWIARKFAPALLDDKGTYGNSKPQPDIEEVPGQPSITIQVRKSGEFTQKELDRLGYRITKDLCDQLCLKPLDYYITAANKKGKSYKISGNDNYPMYFYDYGKTGADGHTWGKIYQPLGDVRFLYFGQKPEDFFFGDRDFLAAYAKAKKGIYPGQVEADDEGGEEVQMKWKQLIICSGPSDALNVRGADAGYHVCWPNSETAELTEYQMGLLSQLAENIYILYDIDDTGIANMYKTALRYLDLKIIQLPNELKNYRDRKGKPCKDAKDFFVHFRRPENQNPYKLFSDLVKLSGGLKFWTVKPAKTGFTFDINNEQLYSFLQAGGFYRIASSANAKGYTFCHIHDNVVTLIDEQAIASTVSSYLLEYLKTHPKYYSQTLANTIYRSNQIRLASLEKLKVIEPNFKSWNETSDHFFFRNGIFRVSADGLKEVKPSDCPCMVYKNKILEHDFKVESPFFDIEYTPEYATLLAQLKAAVPQSPEFFFYKKSIDALGDAGKYRLKILRNDLNFMQYVYNTGRTYWRKEEIGIPLSEDEKAEHDLNFINKVMALGFLMAKHKNAGQPYAVFCMETEQSDEGTHLGGTGKSLYASSLEQMRKQLFIDGQNLQPGKYDFLLQGVEKGITDNVFIDDLNNSVDLHKFMPMITGKMVVNAKYVASYTIDFKDSPKVVFTSNHAIRNFDASLRRRTWFVAFTDYYHADDPQRGLKERSPLTEFGTNLISDYSPEDMNKFYNFMLNCISVWMKLQVRIQPPMRDIEKRILQKSLSDEFLFWAEDWFTENRLNTLVKKDDAFEAYKATLPPKYALLMKMKSFKTKLIQYCTYKDWDFNPESLMTTQSERERNDIRRKVNYEDVYFFYIDTRKNGQVSDDASVSQNAATVSDESLGKPPF